MKYAPLLLAAVALITLFAATSHALMVYGDSNVISIDAVSPVDEPGFPDVVTGIDAIYPNPFNPSTTIKFGMAESGAVELAVFDLKGQLVRILDKGNRSSGLYQATWNGQDGNGKMMSAGAYFCRLVTIDGTQIKKLTLVK